MAQPVSSGHIDGLAEVGRSRFEYDPASGALTWKDPGPEAFDSLKGYRIFKRKFAGKAAGFRSKSDGYIRVTILGRSILAHRLIWAIVYGDDPVDDIDHWDLVRSNNRIENLRPATRSQNCMNKPARRDNASGVKGVHWHRASGKWAASITAKHVGHIHLGVFPTKEEAGAAYQAAARKFHGIFSHGATA